MENALEVVAALIFRGGRFMICRRPVHKARGGLWEFAGGKLEPGETGEEAIVRECREEMGIGIRPLGVFMEEVYAYPDLTIHLTVYRAEITEGEPQCLEHSEIRFITADEADGYAFCPADQAVVRRLRGQ